MKEHIENESNHIRRDFMDCCRRRSGALLDAPEPQETGALNYQFKLIADAGR